VAGVERSAVRSDEVATLKVVIRWKHGLPARRDEPWYWMTNLIDVPPDRLLDEVVQATLASVPK
jgi:hypothetical protein